MRLHSRLFLASIPSITLTTGCLLNPKEIGDYTSAETSTDGMTSETVGTSAGPDPGRPPHHAACELPFPQPAPALPPTFLDADDRPNFDAWTKIDCESLPDLTCEAQVDPPCGRCLQGVEDGPGVCTYFDANIWCEHEALGAISYQGSACYICSPHEVRAYACCNFPDGFDCRTWPYPSDGPPGSICARHEDCEPGLVCGPHLGSGNGICQCPGIVDPQSVRPPESCPDWA